MTVEDQIQDCLNDIDHEKETVRRMKSVMLTFEGQRSAELAENILHDAKTQIRTLEQRLEALRKKQWAS